MKIWKYKLILLSIAVMLLLSFTVEARTESDPQGDVWHYVYPYYQTSTVSNRPNSDIQEISAEISGDQITLSMTLWPGGEFSRGDNGYAQYIMFYNTSDAWYTLNYGDLEGEEPAGMAMGYSTAGYTPPVTTGEVTVNGNTITATMDKVGTDEATTELYGVTWVWEGHGTDQWNYDHWHDGVGDWDWNPDLAPDDSTGDDDDTTGDDDDDDDNSGGGGGTTGGTPGFETLALLAAIAVALLFIRRKK